MARLVSAARMGYYPTPEDLTPLIALHLQRDRPGLVRILDPCAGKGAALQHIGRHLQAETYGIELDRERGLAAKDKLTQCLIADYQSALVSHGRFGLLYLNPPYDWSARPGEIESPERYERTFLRDTIKYLAPGGVLVYLIPLARLDTHIARILAYRFDEVRIYRFPEQLFQRFRQAVIFGRLKDKPAMDTALCSFLEQAGRGSALVPWLPEEPEIVYPVPTSTLTGKFVFRSTRIDLMELESEILAHGLYPDLEALLDPPGLSAQITAVMPLRHGHMAQLIACGFVNGVVFGPYGRNPLVVKGRTQKVSETRVEIEDGQEKEIENQRLVITIKAFNGQGDLITIK